VKASVLEAATTTAKLVKTDLTDQTNLLPRDKVTVGIAAKSKAYQFTHFNGIVDFTFPAKVSQIYNNSLLRPT